MTERSMFWADGIGDGGPYSEDELRLLYDALAGAEDANRGVFISQGNELAPSSTGNNNIRMAVGRGVVDGTLYENDAILDIVTASPAIGTTGRRLVLQKDWAARTVRAAIITSADGVGAIPALTQNDGTIWEIPIASFTITTGGVIGALTDQRQFCEGTSVQILDRDLSQVSIVSDAVERSIYSYEIAGGALGATGGFKLRLGAHLFFNAAGTLTIRIKLGATTALITQSFSFAQNADPRRVWLEVLCMNSAAGAQKWTAAITVGSATNDAAASLPVSLTGSAGPDDTGLGAGYGSSAEDTTGPLTFDVTVQWSAALAGLNFQKEIAVLELLPAA